MIEEKYISNIINDILSIVDNAKLAVEIALKEEREKAANAFCYVNCHKLKGGDCSMVDECGGFKNFKELLNKEQ